MGRDLKLGKGAWIGYSVSANGNLIVLELFNHDIGVIHTEGGLRGLHINLELGVSREVPDERQRDRKGLIPAGRGEIIREIVIEVSL